MDKSLKQQVYSLLMGKDYNQLIDLCSQDRQVWKILRASLYETDEQIYWPATEAIAMLMRRWWQEGQEERVREYIRGLFWSLNDESGGIGWNAPQTIAEIIVKIPDLIDPYGSMMIDRTMEETLLVENGLWAVGRMGRDIEPAVRFFQDNIFKVFEIEDSRILGTAAWAMGEVGFAPALPLLEALNNNTEHARIYLDGKYAEKSIGQWAQDAITKINSRISSD